MYHLGLSLLHNKIVQTTSSWSIQKYIDEIIAQLLEQISTSRLDNFCIPEA